MSRYVTLAVVLCACIGIAYGAAVKITDFTTSDSEPLTADGMAILNYASGADKTVVQIILSDFTPNETYDLRIINGDQKLDTDDVLTTDQHGHGTFHGTFFFDKSTWDVELYVSEDHNYEADELHAVGDNPAS